MNMLIKLSTLVVGLALVASCTSNPSNTGSTTSRSTSSGTSMSSKPAAKSSDTTPAAAKVSAKPTDDLTQLSKNGAPIYYPAGTRDSAALAIEKLVPSEVAVGSDFDYQIKVSNVSNTALEDVMVKETLDENFTLTNSAPKGNAGAGRVMAFDLGNIPANSSKTITITGKASKPGMLTSCATLDYKIPSCATIKVSSPGLAITKTMMSDALVCDTITGKITVSNPGSGVTRGVTIQDVLAEGLMTVDNKKSIDINVGDLNPGQSKDYAFQLKAAKTGKFTNMAKATAEGSLKADSQAVSVTVRQPVLEVKTECPEGPMFIGRDGTYKFTVKNKGDAPAANAVLNVSIPTSMKFKNADNGGAASGDRLSYKLGTLAPGETKIVSATYANSGPGVITARAQLTAVCAEAVLDSCEATVQGVADIGTLLTDDFGVTTVGQNQVYRCNVKNQGQLDLTNVVVVASWPSELVWVTSDQAGVAGAAGKAEFKFGTVKVGETREFKFTLKATKSGEYKISTDTTAKEIKNTTHQDEITTFIDR